MQHIEDFNAHLSKQRMSRNTISNYTRAIEGFFRFMEEQKAGILNPKDIVENDIEKYKIYLLEVSTLNPKTVKNKLSSLSKFYEYLLEMGITSYNPVKLVKKIKVKYHTPQQELFSQDDLDKFTKSIYEGQNIRDIAIYELFYNTGIRVSELCDIEVDDIQLRYGKGNLVIREHETLGHNENLSGYKVKQRVIPLNSHVQKIISAYISCRPITPDIKLFQGKRGPLRRDGVFRIFQKYAKEAGVEKVGPNTLRHRFFTELYSRGTDIHLISFLMGHSSIHSTARYLMNPLNEKKAIESLTIKSLRDHKNPNHCLEYLTQLSEPESSSDLEENKCYIDENKYSQIF